VDMNEVCTAVGNHVTGC